jgi:hypothetical protein
VREERNGKAHLGERSREDMDTRRLPLAVAGVLVGAYVTTRPLALYLSDDWRFVGLGVLAPAVTLLVGVALVGAGLRLLGDSSGDESVD